VIPRERRKYSAVEPAVRTQRQASRFITRLSEIIRQHREARILDALADDAIRERRAGRTRTLRDYARERNIAIDDQ
jgi:hypothetical protein